MDGCAWGCSCTYCAVTRVHGAHVHIVDIVDIPTSISVKWESDPQCPPSDISSAAGNNEFELDGLPLGQVGSMCGDGKFL